MNRITYIFFFMVALVVTPAPIVHAQETGVDLLDKVLDELNDPNAETGSINIGFSRDGIFGCSGGQYGAVGAQGPSGAHVPVFDGAVHDQERLLTYKECLLDGALTKRREALVGDIISRTVTWANAGFEGNPAYVTNIPLHFIEQISDPEAERIITGAETDRLAEPFRRDVRVALAKYYAGSTREPEAALGCDLSNDQLEALSQGDFIRAGGWSTLLSYSRQSSCNPLFAYQNATARLNSALTEEQTREQMLLDWGNGFRTSETERTINLGGGETSVTRRVVTPGFLIADQLSQTLGTGLRQAESADEIDEVVAGVLSHLSVKLLSDVDGFSGLARSINGQPSYLDRLVSETAANARGSISNAAITVINNTIKVEQEYGATRKASVVDLIQSRNQLEAWERTCWSGLIDQARADVSNRAQERACAQSRGGITNTFASSTPCTISVSVTEELERGVLGITVPSEDHISVYGRASQGGINIAVTAGSGEDVVGPEVPTVLTTGNWSTSPMDVAPLPDGIFTVSAIETLSSSGSTLAPLTAQVGKVTTITGIELTPPTTFPALTITATASGGVVESTTIATSTTRSRNVITQNIQPVLDVLRENILRSEKALQVLTKIKETLAATASVNGQRFVLERLDQLVATRVLHTEAQLRQARDQALEITGAMKLLLEETREEWEGGWCDPDNWEQHAS